MKLLVHELEMFMHPDRKVWEREEERNTSVTGGHEIPDKNLITPDRRDILSEPEALLSRRPVLPMLEAGLENPAYRLRLSIK